MSELKQLHKELSKITWVGADEGWDLAITEVLKEITKRIDAQPEATKPAQDLGAAIPDGWQLVPKEPTKEMIASFAFKGDVEMAIGHAAIFEEACEDYAEMLAVAPSPADALVAGDRVDAERYRHLRELMQFSTPPNKPTTMKLRAALPAPEHQPHRDWMGEHFDASVDRTVDADIRACLTAEEIPEFDASRAAIQAQKDGHHE